MTTTGAASFVRAPGHPISAAVLLMDSRDRILIVHPARPGAPWALPGGLVEVGESPVDAVRREVREELGIEVDVRAMDLFAVEWLQATRPGRRDRLAFVFAGPRLPTSETDRITLQRDELDRWTVAAPAEALGLLHPRIADRIRGPLHRPGSTLYRETRNERTTTP
ncbi:NUDIX domain-containing protein [Streptomyces sp. NPDC088182]|uniref:NUDIX domain-containing protein n=1 Tax=Streptomyces sp. NPDC088182 TaxID=3365838 RepID=UPI003818B294